MARRATIRAHGALTDFLSNRDSPFDVEFELPVGLRDLVQSTGIPHVEVGTVRLDGSPATWSDTVDDGATIELLPRYPLNVAPAGFVADVHLGKLARHLRLLGIDTLHHPEADDPSLVSQANNEDRTLLTRDRLLLMRSALRHGSYVRATDPIAQGIEVVGRFALAPVARPFSRCLECNGALLRADPDTLDVPVHARQRYDEFHTCARCQRVYWRGSHIERLERIIARLLPA